MHIENIVMIQFFENNCFFSGFLNLGSVRDALRFREKQLQFRMNCSQDWLIMTGLPQIRSTSLLWASLFKVII